MTTQTMMSQDKAIPAFAPVVDCVIHSWSASGSSSDSVIAKTDG